MTKCNVCKIELEEGDKVFIQEFERIKTSGKQARFTVEQVIVHETCAG